MRSTDLIAIHVGRCHGAPVAVVGMLTNEALDPDAKIPDFNYCAIRVSAA